ncbi:MAG: choice-of-anchor L domain-containing protein, partial [Bacteroidales bacterium]|nr:choice-of-anchor L domain-containing protein [Bacteroidales bacterium]
MKTVVLRRYLSFKIVSVVVIVFLTISSGICNAQELVISDSLRCFDKDTPVSELLEYVQKGSGSDSTCYLEALALLKALDILPGSKMILEERVMPPITIGAVMQQKQDTVPPFGVQGPRVGDTKKKSGSRGAKDSSGNSIRVDHEDDAPYNNYSATELVQEVLVTGCLTADNVTFEGDESKQIGYFNRGTADFPFEEGIVLSTGNVTDAEGPNTATNITTEVNTGGDDQLQSIATETVRDASVLEFDFVPAGDIVTFNYIFASEEYPEWACSDYNDVFGFFVTSKENDGFGYNNTNVAELPNNQGVVSINNVHGPGRSYGSSYTFDQTLNNPDGCSTVFFDNFSNSLGSNWSFRPSNGNWEYNYYDERVYFDYYTSRIFNYNQSIESRNISVMPGLCTQLNVFIYFEDRNNTGDEYLEIEVFNGVKWNSVQSYVNNGDFFGTYTFDISPYVTGSNIKVRFRAHGDDSRDISYYYIDNVKVTQSGGTNTTTSYYSFNVDASCGAKNASYYVDQSTYANTEACNCIDEVGGFPPYTTYSNIEADGRTVKLTATFAAVPCSTYHIKLAVGDVNDRKYDSWVFLEANSFQSNDIELTACSNGEIGETAIFEGCQTSNNYFVVSRADGDVSQELAVKVDYSPPGVNGDDILQLDGTLLPETIYIPAGSESETIFFYAKDDGIPEDP